MITNIIEAIVIGYTFNVLYYLVRGMVTRYRNTLHGVQKEQEDLSTVEVDESRRGPADEATVTYDEPLELKSYADTIPVDVCRVLSSFIHQRYESSIDGDIVWDQEPQRYGKRERMYARMAQRVA